VTLTHAAPGFKHGRVVILGAAGFIGSAVGTRLHSSGLEVIRLARQDLDLSADGAGATLADRLRPGDCLVFAAARAPVKSNDMLIDNLRMADAVCQALDNTPISHLVYVSSDAVYADGPLPLTESSPTAPSSLHGVMHLAREIMLGAADVKRFCVVRPTLVYGVGDPHDGYGPNQFLRLANEALPITLFGEGEERRDHVHISDVAELIARAVESGSAGTLNIATGVVTSFRDVAELAINTANSSSQIEVRPRSGPMPHGGFRPFDVSATYESFANFSYLSLREGLSLR
jgi:UDP-glucose 4-epimerase